MNLKHLKELARAGYTFIPVIQELPSDTLTPVAALMRLRKSAHTKAFLLESAEGGEHVGRYSFLGIDPFSSLHLKNGRLTYHSQKEHYEDEVTDPVKTIDAYLKKYRAPYFSEHPPFTGGAIGYISYDFVQNLERISLPSKELSAPEAHLFFYGNLVVFDSLKHRVLIISHIKPEEEKIEAGLRRAKAEIEKIKKSLFTPATREKPLDLALDDYNNIKPIPAKAMMGEELYCAAVRRIKRYIRNGDIFQCVLSDRFSFPIDVDPFIVYRILRMLNPSPYLFYLAMGEEILLGSSPEMLVRSRRGIVETCPIAGTRPRGKNAEDDRRLERDLLASVKEKAEHLMLVDLGRNDIGRVSVPGSVKVREFMQVHRYSHVMHLVSLVEGKLRRNVSAWDAFTACFPAGTLSGAPKVRAMEIISELEVENRGTYGGAVFAHDFAGNLNSCITIRSLLVKNAKGYIQAGAGIVADSRPKKEYEECLNKAAAVRKAVAIAKLLDK